MALTQSDLDSLDSAIASGVLEVRLEGRLFKYQTMDDLLKAREYVSGVVNSAGRSQRVSFRYNFTTQRE